jgi:lantibiotic modifying enzyme
MPRRWTPLLEGEAAERAAEAVHAIAADLRARRPTPCTPAADAGFALFFGELSRAGGAADHALAVALIEQAMDGVGEGDVPPSLFKGFTGVALAVELLTGRVLAPPADDHDDPCADVDEALEGLLDAEPFHEQAPFDLIDGLVGFGVHALARLGRPSARRVLGKVIARLDQLSVKRADGRAWRSPPHPFKLAFPAGTLDLGVAHGVAGVIGLLGAACAAGVEEARPILQGAVSFLLAQEERGDRTCFPTALVPDGTRPPIRSAWCYGDPGIAAALLVAGRGAGEPAWEAAALRVARVAVTRPPEDTFVVDAGICHGAAGLGHVYNRLFQATGDEAIGEAARSWMDRALGMRRAGTGIGGYQTYTTFQDLSSMWHDDFSFLGGAPGIGLALMAATSGEEPAWDRMLAVSPVGGDGDHR